VPQPPPARRRAAPVTSPGTVPERTRSARSITGRLAPLAIALALVAGPLAGPPPPASAKGVSYRLPWTGGVPVRLTQGWGGSYSHHGLARHGYDFGLPEGTAVRAAAAGLAAAGTVGGHKACGGPELGNKANRVVIDHADGTSTLYLHLQSVAVAPGQRVSRGQVIGRAGKTGWTRCRTHLHFQRQRQGGWYTQSQPIHFGEYPGQRLRTERFYVSRNAGGGRPPASKRNKPGTANRRKPGPAKGGRGSGPWRVLRGDVELRHCPAGNRWWKRAQVRESSVVRVSATRRSPNGASWQRVVTRDGRLGWVNEGRLRPSDRPARHRKWRDVRTIGPSRPARGGTEVAVSGRKGTWRRTKGEVRLRHCPAGNAWSTSGTVKQGAALSMRAKRTDAKGRTWVRVLTRDGRLGWVSAKRIERTGPPKRPARWSDVRAIGPRGR
jgi:murein DD-endopeptidase MepM/ murein hydrolase activator NlpD